MDIKADLTWLQKHEKLILGVFLLSVILFIGNKAINYLDAKEMQEMRLYRRKSWKHKSSRMSF